MTDRLRADVGALRPAAIVSVVATALVAATALVLFVALDDDETSAPTTTTTEPTPTTSTTVVVERQVTLVDEDESGLLFDVAGVRVTADDLLEITADEPVPEEYPVVIDPTFADAQADADLSLERLRHQVRFLANALGPAVTDAALEPSLVVVARPRFDDRTLHAAVLVVNTEPTPRRLTFIDLRILGSNGSPVTERVRFLGATGGFEVPPTTAYFNLVAFSDEQVVDPDADLAEYSWSADVRWLVPGS